MKEYERKQLLERIDRESSTIGAAIPEELVVQGEPVPLREFVFEIKRRETIPEGERERVEEAKRNLRRERRERRSTIEAGEVSFEAGQELASAIVGIDRALEALEQLEPVDLEAEAKRTEAADTKRWMSFLKRALGQEDESQGTRGRGRGRR